MTSLRIVPALFAALLAPLLAALIVAAAAYAQSQPSAEEGKEAAPTVQDPLTAKRAVELENQLRCLVCQNETIAESGADLAADLRRQVREQIAQGRTDREIIDYMVARYGDFVLFRPPLKATTVLLWTGPALLVLIGVIVLVRTLRRRKADGADEALSADERRRAARILEAGNGDAK